ncbi:MAG: DUF2344 domain-containing protein [Chloroflexi bacterium]|nr:DUF2344 domain-containing protein [Chloroflexota bacterium]
MNVQRLRLTFGRDERLKYVSHLDMMRLWQRAFNRAGVPLAYSQGFSPHPRISTAAPLAVGVTSNCELLDVFLEPAGDPSAFLDRIEPEMPPGLRLTAAAEVALDSPSLPSRLRFAEYETAFAAGLPAAEIASRLEALLSAPSLPRERLRDGRVKHYDLRPLIADLRPRDGSARHATIWMRLQANPSGSGRPEEVLAAMGIEAPPLRITRVGLILDQ